MVSCVGLHNDERYWDEPDKFKPERFARENRGSIVPGTGRCRIRNILVVSSSLRFRNSLHFDSATKQPD